MRKQLSLLALCGLLLSGSFATAGVLKGAAQDLKAAATVASYPVRHPKKSARAAKNAAVKSARAVSKF